MNAFKTLCAVVCLSLATFAQTFENPNYTYQPNPRVSPDGASKVEQIPSQLFEDTFDWGLDPSKWTGSSGGTGVAPTNATGGSTVLSSGTTANSFSKLLGPILQPTEPGQLLIQARINIEFPVLTTGYRFWGIGNSLASPTIANPCTDCIGFEVATSGKMFAVTYGAGTRTVIQDLSSATGNSKQPGDASVHKYFIKERGDLTFFSIDTPENVVASYLTGAPGPTVNTLPLMMEAISNVGTTVTITDNATTTGDSARNNVTISDAFYPFRRINLCNKTAFISGLAATTTQIVGVPATGAYPSSVIKICSVILANTNATASNVKLVEGTGTNCATNQTQLTGNVGLAAAPSNFGISFSPGAYLITNVGGDALCATGSAAGAVDVTITYYQGLN